MGIAVHIQAYQDGEQSAVSGQRVREAFGPFVRDGGLYDWHVRYDEQNYCDVLLHRCPYDETLLRGITIDRPCGDLRLWEALASLLKLGNLVFIGLGSCPPLIAAAGVAQHLPPDMTEALGPPRCVSTGSEISDAVRAL